MASQDMPLSGWQSESMIGFGGGLSLLGGNRTPPSPSSSSEVPDTDSSMSLDSPPQFLRLESPSASEISTYVSDAVEKGKNLLVECPPALDRQILILQSALFTLQKGKSKIYLAVETFQDVDLTLKAIQAKLSTSPLLQNVKMTVIGPRKSLCINEEVTGSYQTDLALEERCVHLTQNYNSNIRNGIQGTSHAQETCPFYPNTVTNPQPLNLIRQTLPGVSVVADIEDLLNNGQEYLRCPFYSTRQLHPEANVVILPVKYLLSPIHRRENQIELNQSIIIIDEGYNLEQLCFQAGSITITRSDLTRAQSALRTITSHRGLDVAILNLFNGLVDPIQFLSHWIHTQAMGERRPNKQLILEELSKLDVNEQNINLICDALQSLPLQPNVIITNYKELQKLKQFFHVLCTALNNPDDYDLVIKGVRVNDYDESIPTLLMFCGNASVILSNVEGHAKTLIVGGSCLSPLPPFMNGLGVEFEKLQVSYDPDDTLNDCYFMGYCDKGPTEVTYALGYGPRADSAVLLEIAKAILELSRVIPNGLVVLFHSRSYFEMVMEFMRLNEDGIACLREIKRFKHVTNELTLTEENQLEMERFKQLSKEPTGAINGALLFADARSPFYSKLDLKGKEIRGVVHVSIAYGAWYNDDFIAKRKFFESSGNANHKEDNKYWYECEAFRRTNQAFGKCLKERNDWGVVIILDSRMPEKSHKFKDYLLPVWVTNLNLMKHFRFGRLIEKVQEFVANRSD